VPYRDWLKLAGPPWLQGEIARAFLGEVGGALDDQRDRLVEATTASMPGLAPTDALEEIGTDRMLPRGSGESDQDYAERLRLAFDTWALFGSHRALLEQLALQGYGTGVIIQRNGLRTSLSGGVVTYTSMPEWTFDWRPSEFYNQFGILFPADVPALVDGSEEAAIVHALALRWRPAKALYFGFYVVTGTPVWGWPTTRTWGSDNWDSGGSRFIPAP
jgi:hypothetical protein